MIDGDAWAQNARELSQEGKVTSRMQIFSSCHFWFCTKFGYNNLKSKICFLFCLEKSLLTSDIFTRKLAYYIKFGPQFLELVSKFRWKLSTSIFSGQTITELNMWKKRGKLEFFSKSDITKYRSWSIIFLNSSCELHLKKLFYALD